MLLLSSGLDQVFLSMISGEMKKIKKEFIVLRKMLSLVLPVILLQLTACSGDSSSNNSAEKIDEPVLDPILVEQIISLSVTLPLKLIVGDQFIPSLTAQGSAAITVNSSDELIASIDGEGTINALAPGVVTITVSIGADERYLAASASYEVNVANNNFTVSAWVGESNSNFSFSTGTDGIEFYRSNDADCDLLNYASCTNGELDILSGNNDVNNSILNEATALTTNTYATFKFGSYNQELEFNFGKFSNRGGMRPYFSTDEFG